MSDDIKDLENIDRSYIEVLFNKDLIELYQNIRLRKFILDMKDTFNNLDFEKLSRLSYLEKVITNEMVNRNLKGK